MESKHYQIRELDKAKDKAVWLNFGERLKKAPYQDRYEVVDGPEFFSVVNQAMLEELGTTSPYTLPESYENLSWEAIKIIQRDPMPIAHWEELIGTISSMDGEVLRFILQYKVNLFRIIRCVLASRGYDENQVWIGFTKAEELWKNLDDAT